MCIEGITGQQMRINTLATDFSLILAHSVYKM
jgi:hypothetical protein